VEVYSVGGRASVAAVANVAIAVFWNPSTDRSLSVVGLDVVVAVDVQANWYTARATAEGTPGSTVTPDVGNAFGGSGAPPSGCRLALGSFSVQPTLDAGPFLTRFIPNTAVGARVGSGQVTVYGPARQRTGIVVPPGEGLAVVQTPATASTLDVAVRWIE